MSKTDFDSEFCGALPIHHINTVQPHGAVLVVAQDNLAVVQTSTNVGDYVGYGHKEIVGKGLDELSGIAIEELRHILEQHARKGTIYVLSLNGHKLVSLIHRQAENFLLEVQQQQTGRKIIGDLPDLKNLIAALESANSLPEICDLVVAQLQEILNIDGVMMYKFDKDWNGTVISEQKRNGLEDYLGVTFPASDVPRQARELYLKNPVRLIPDRHYAAARLYPVINPLTSTFTDLSPGLLRGVADVHLEYLSNMKVVGSMSIRVTHNSALWGLISCHHRSAYHLSFEECINFSLLSDIISNKISSVIHANEFKFIGKMQADRNTIVDTIYNTGSIKEGILGAASSILRLFKANGAVLFIDGRVYPHGEVPDAYFLENLHLWLQAKKMDKIWETHNLPAILEEAARYGDIASGMLVIPISSDKPDYVVCFRSEVVKTIDWGGNPHQAINFEENSLTYHPRHSFKVWKETVNQTAQPWQEQEVQIAHTLRSFLLEFKS